METLVWAPVGSADGLVGGTTVPFEAVGLSLTLVPTDDGELFVVSGKCPPTGLPLEGADVDSEAKTVSCPQFGTRWSLETGEVVGQWMPSPPVVSSVLRLLFREPEGILTYPVRLTADSKIEVLVDADAKADFEKRYWKGVLDASGKANGGYY
ncbi:hypothetical protein BU14_0640s0008 [Porphyra umbilicalis]|uniref:Rieske domain-containing protein n=1 Tax=Porphyra umbilicalis TaxID=2786 RepID=A0A1X6NQQ5_PORUM|nr:hypothetical protein BU14_0640s0008 [Porphyra umbilicalis]|eukprot:OSX70902.1 hypothetical protein BU14_0640s0008 [Porphyra umbilicalis]